MVEVLITMVVIALGILGIAALQARTHLGSVESIQRAQAVAVSRDMASRDYFDHTSPEGKGPSDRAVAAGYQGSFVGENIAAGQTDPSRVVQAWMESPGHCLNIMEPRYRVLGVGYFLDQNDRFAHYWTQNFGN